MNSNSTVDYGSMVDSSVDSQSDSEVKFDSDPGSATDSGYVADFDSATGSDSATEKHFMPRILRLDVGSSQQYAQL